MNTLIATELLPATRHAPKRVLVVHRDADRRQELRTSLEATGADVTSCPGPVSAWCQAVHNADGAPCSRLLGVQQVVMDPLTARTTVPRAYRRWVPSIVIEVDDLAVINHHTAADPPSDWFG